MALRNAFADLATDDDIEKLAYILHGILDKLPYQDAGTGGARAFIANSPNIGTVTTLTTLTNEAQIGGLQANGDQYVQFQIAYQNIRNRITVT